MVHSVQRAAQGGALGDEVACSATPCMSTVCMASQVAACATAGARRQPQVVLPGCCRAQALHACLPSRQAPAGPLHKVCDADSELSCTRDHSSARVAGDVKPCQRALRGASGTHCAACNPGPVCCQPQDTKPSVGSIRAATALVSRAGPHAAAGSQARTSQDAVLLGLPVARGSTWEEAQRLTQAGVRVRQRVHALQRRVACVQTISASRFSCQPWM